MDEKEKISGAKDSSDHPTTLLNEDDQDITSKATTSSQGKPEAEKKRIAPKAPPNISAEDDKTDSQLSLKDTPGAAAKFAPTPERQKKFVTVDINARPPPLLEPLMPKGLVLSNKEDRKALQDKTKHRSPNFKEVSTKEKAAEEFKRTINTYLPSRTLYRTNGHAIRSASRQASTLPIQFAGGKDLPIAGLQMRHLSSAHFRRSQALFDSKRLSSQFTGVKHTPDFAEIAVEEFQLGDEAEPTTEDQQQQLAAIRNFPLKMGDKRKLRADILDAEVEPPTRKEAFDQRQQEMLKKFKDFIKGHLNKFRIWAQDMKTIEGRFGTGVVSYFIFLKWLLFLNILIFIIFLIFIVLPQALFAPVIDKHRNITFAPNFFLDSNFIHQFPSAPPKQVDYLSHNNYSLDKSLRTLDGSIPNLDGKNLDELGRYFNSYIVPDFLDVTLYAGRENYTTEDRHNLSEYCAEVFLAIVKNRTQFGIGSRIQDLLEGSGWLANTLLFIGFYQPSEVLVGTLTYNMPLAFLAVLIVLVLVCISMMLSYASRGIRETLVEDSVQMKYCHMLFCGWDFCISNKKSARLKQSSISRELKSTLYQERRLAEIQKWTLLYKIRIFIIRCSVNIAVLLSLVGSYFIVYYVAKKQLESERTASSEGIKGLVIKFLPAVTVSALNFIMPLVFLIVVRFEHYPIRTEINTVLMRSVLIRLASIIILISSFYHQITCMPQDKCGLGEDSALCPSPICWETYVGQQMYRLVLMDCIIVVGVTFCVEVPRNYLVQRYKNKLTTMIGRQDFDIPTQVLSLVYSQTLCWVGMFYSPLLPAICVIKTVIFFYVKKYTLLHNCIPAKVPYKASRSNSIFMMVLMLSFFMMVAILGYSISRIVPSPGCSPFRYYNRKINAVNDAMQYWSPELNTVLSFLFSSLFAIPVIVLLCLAIYYYLTLSAAHKRMVKVLKVQLVLEGRDKQFLLARLTEVARHEATKKL